MSILLLSTFTDSQVLKIILYVVDIAIIAFVVYKGLLLIRGTRAVQLAKGVLILLVIAIVSSFIDLHLVSWVLAQIWPVFFVALVVIFQPELRRALEQIGRGQFFFRKGYSLSSLEVSRLIDEITDALVSFSETKTGALVLIERETGLKDYIETGIAVDAVVSKELLLNIFAPNTPMHDGAIIIRGDRVMAAACFLPLTDNPYIRISLGTRHRAAIGISEVSDAVTLVVSEETGTISMAKDGKLVLQLDEKQLREILSSIYDAERKSSIRYFWQRRKKKQ
ncbi:MAG: diadenylate cyclase CdaA [Bacillota bacterium]